MNTPDEIGLYKHLNQIAAYLREASDAGSALRFSLRSTREFFGASHACLAVLPLGQSVAELVFSVPQGTVWDGSLLAAFLGGRRPTIPPEVMLAKVKRRDRPWGVLGLRREDGAFPKGSFRDLARVADAISEAVQRIDRERLLEVRARIDHKLVQQVPPKDLFYQILDGLRSLTAYDHSSAVLIYEAEGSRLKLVAEQIAWLKAKSRRIGLSLPLSAVLVSAMQDDAVYGFDRIDDRWQAWPGQRVPELSELASLLDYNDGDRPEGGTAESREGTMLCAPLTTRDGLLGVLKVAARHPGAFGPYEAGLLGRFTPLASVAIQNSQRTETLHARMQEAVRKHAIVDLARGVSHDVNNALGSVIPLVQQMQEDVRSGRMEAGLFEKDLQDVERSLQICRRIFGGMVSFARGSARSAGEGDVRRAIDGTCGVLGDSLERKGIRLELQVPDAIPPIRGGQGDLEQLFLNLITNARDATPGGGTISVRARPEAERVEVVIRDTGCGIPREILSRIEDPFFTTKPHGAGLGLSTCRWIIWQMRGELWIESEPGTGTTITVRLPIAGEPAEGDPPENGPGGGA